MAAPKDDPNPEREQTPDGIELEDKTLDGVSGGSGLPTGKRTHKPVMIQGNGLSGDPIGAIDNS